MVADYAADFTRLGFPPSLPRHFISYVQDKRKSHFIPPPKTDGRRAGGRGRRLRGGPGNDSRKSARARRGASNGVSISI